MKTFVVNITDEVQVDIRDAILFIHERSPENAVKWFRGLYKAIDTLEAMPERCPLIRENDAFKEDVRNLLYHSHRIIFTVNHTEAVVQVHAFRHGAQDHLDG